MQILKVVNNNIVISRDGNGVENVLMGRGLGFKTKKGDLIDSDKIEKVFTMQDSKVSHRFQELVSEIPMERVLISNAIIQYAKDRLQKNINDNIYVALTDHINFAIERVEMGVPFQNPFFWEVKKFYYQEYLIGQAAIRMIERKLKVTLPMDEVAFIALHIVNAELDMDMTQITEMTKLVDDILGIVDECFDGKIDKDSVYYERFITHLKFFSQRIFAGKEVESDDTEFQEIIRNKYQDCVDCVEKIKKHIQEKCNHEMKDEEMMYLTVHIRRVTMR